MNDDIDIDNVIDMASRKPTAETTWATRLRRDKDGNVLPTVANLMLILAYDPALRGMLAYNAFTAEPLIMRAAPVSDEGEPELPGPYPRPWGAADVVLVLAYLQRVWTPRASLQTAEAAMLTEATLRQFHPIVDWLNDLVWDGKPRLDYWLTAAFDAEPTDFHKAAGAKTLIAAVRRVKRPGCKFDTMLILEGAQGIGKSRALRALFGEAWFSDAIPPDLTSKDAAMALLGVWCLEFAEIEHLIRAEVETIKAFLSRPVDRYRPPYGKAYIERPRQGVLIGTTNSDDYLRDATGNRRIWPIRCNLADPEWIEFNREQLWAEAVVREAAGEPIWLDNEEVRQAATDAQAGRIVSDAWADRVASYVAGKLDVTIADVMVDGIGMPLERIHKAGEIRVGLILRQMGWTKSRQMRAGVQQMIWSPPLHNSAD